MHRLRNFSIFAVIKTAQCLLTFPNVFKFVYPFLDKYLKAIQLLQTGVTDFFESFSWLKFKLRSALVQVPQWASWALKSLSGKFYKGTPPTQNPATLGNKEGPQSHESTPSTGTSESKSPEATPIKHTDDGWGDLEEDLSAESEEKWEDANDATANYVKKGDGWDDELDGVSFIFKTVKLSEVFVVVVHQTVTFSGSYL